MQHQHDDEESPSILRDDLIKIRNFFRSNYQKYTPYEKNLRYNMKHGFIVFANIYKGGLPQVAVSTTTATLSMISGSMQLIDGALLLSQKSLHATRDNIKGIAKVLSGATGIALSYTPWLAQFGVAGLTSATALAAPAFALTQLVDLTCNAIDLHYALKEKKFSGWLEERYKEVAKYEKKLQQYEEKIRSGNGKDDVIEKKINDLLVKKTKLEEDILTRIICEKNDNPDKFNKVDFKSNKLKKLHEKFSQIDAPVNDDLRKRNDEIKAAIKKNIKEKRKNVAIKALAFSGALLLTIAPFTGPAAPALFGIGLAVSIGVGLYSGAELAKKNKHVKKLFSEMTDKFTRFFAPREEKEQELTSVADMGKEKWKPAQPRRK